MKLIDEPTLELFRTPGFCELCRRFCKKREPHHVRGRGAGGAMRIDHPWNLMALGADWACQCHRLIHNGEVHIEQLWAIVAAREKQTPEVLEAEVKRLQRQTKEQRREEESG